MTSLSTSEVRAARDARIERAFRQDEVVSVRAETNWLAIERWERVLLRLENEDKALGSEAA